MTRKLGRQWKWKTEGRINTREKRKRGLEKLWIGVEEDEDLDFEVGRSPGKKVVKIDDPKPKEDCEDLRHSRVRHIIIKVAKKMHEARLKRNYCCYWVRISSFVWQSGWSAQEHCWNGGWCQRYTWPRNSFGKEKFQLSSNSRSRREMVRCRRFPGSWRNQKATAGPWSILKRFWWMSSRLGLTRQDFLRLAKVHGRRLGDRRLNKFPMETLKFCM